MWIKIAVTVTSFGRNLFTTNTEPVFFGYSRVFQFFERFSEFTQCQILEM